MNKTILLILTSPVYQLFAYAKPTGLDKIKKEKIKQFY